MMVTRVEVVLQFNFYPLLNYSTYTDTVRAYYVVYTVVYSMHSSIVLLLHSLLLTVYDDDDDSTHYTTASIAS